MVKKRKKSTSGAIPFIDILWQAANKMRGSMDAAEYKNVALGLIFLKYISDNFDKKQEELVKQFTKEGIKQRNIGDELEIRDYYTADNVFWVPKEARWVGLQKKSKSPAIGTFVDEAMQAIENHNPTLKGVLPKEYGRREIDKRILGEIFDLIGNIGFVEKEDDEDDILGRVYEYFIGKFAILEGRRAGQYFTPSSIVKLLVEMIEPYKGRVFDPCCGSGGMFVQSKKFIQAHGGNIGDISVYGQESNPTTWKLAKMNLAIRGIEANLGGEFSDSFHNDKHKSLKAEYILANPPFNDSDWDERKRLENDLRWKFGIPSKGNANFAWVQHFIHHLSPTGIAGFVLSNGSLSSQTSNEGKIRKALVENDLVDCIIGLPGQLFLTTQIPACLWFLKRNKNKNKSRNRQGEILFVDARKFGHLIDRTTRVFSHNDIKSISEIYHKWKNTKNFKNIKGFCKSASLREVAEANFLLTPGRYVGIEDSREKEKYIFEERFFTLKEKLIGLQTESTEIDELIIKAMEELDFGRME